MTFILFLAGILREFSGGKLKQKGFFHSVPTKTAYPDLFRSASVCLGAEFIVFVGIKSTMGILQAFKRPG
jgi:hypothetical protein